MHTDPTQQRSGSRLPNPQQLVPELGEIGAALFKATGNGAIPRDTIGLVQLRAGQLVGSTYLAILHAGNLRAATHTDLTSGVRLRPTLTPQQVATAIADSAHHGRGEVTVPRWLAPMGLVEELTPTPVLWWLERFVGGTEYGGYDPARRKDYLDRIRQR